MQKESKEKFQSPQIYVHVDKDQQQNSSLEPASSGIVPVLKPNIKLCFCSQRSQTNAVSQ